MVLDFNKTLQEALKNIGLTDHQEFVVHDQEEERTYLTSDETIGRYGDVKWAVVDLLNEQYSKILESPFDLYNWLHKNENDEVSYFINEAGSNSLNHSDFKAPSKFHLWLGSKGFVIAIEQKGRGFDAVNVHELQIKDNEGAAFDFFRKCRSRIFFDNPTDARIVFMEYVF